MKLNGFVKKASNAAIGIISILTLFACLNILIVNLLMSFFDSARISLIEVIAIFIAVAVILFIWVKWHHKLDMIAQKRVNKIVIIGFIIFFILQLIYIINFRMEPGWDYGWLVHLARKVVNGIPWEEADIFYMYSYQHNYPSMIAYLGIFKLFGENFNYIFGVGLICVITSMGLIQLLLKKLFAPKMQLIGFVLMTCFYPFLAYPLIAYSDILALPFLCLALYFILDKDGFDFSWKAMIGFSISLGIGSLFKILCIIPLIAIIIILILKQSKKIVLMLFPIAVYLLMNLGFGTVVDSLKLSPVSYGDSGVTPLYYINLGLNTENKGGYNDDDYNYFVSLGYAFTEKEQNEIKSIYWNSIKERLSIPVPDLLHHYQNKIYKSWTNGQMQMEEYILVRSLNTENPVYQFFTAGVGEKILSFVTQGWYVLLLFCMTVYFYSKRKEKSDLFLLLELVFLGMFFYLLIFEAGSRYTWIFVPFMVLSAVQGLEQLGERLNNDLNYNKINETR